MKALFGIVSPVVALALVGLIAARQLKTVVPVPAAPGPAESGTASGPAAGGTVREQSRQVHQRIRDDVAKALEQGAAGRANEVDK